MSCRNQCLVLKKQTRDRCKIIHLITTNQNLKVCKDIVFIFEVDVQQCPWDFLILFVIFCQYIQNKWPTAVSITATAFNLDLLIKYSKKLKTVHTLYCILTLKMEILVNSIVCFKKC